jgi:predicted nucleic acid-binding protein
VELTVLDTGPIVGWLRADDPDHVASVAAIKRSAAAGRLLATTWEVIGEAYTLIRYRFAKDSTPALHVLRWSETVDVLTTEPADRVRAHGILGKHVNLRLSYVDALVLAVSERRQADELVTLDNELAAVHLSSPVHVTIP